MTTSQETAVVLLSGGLDSMVAAAIALERGFAVHALTIDYNQRHRCEVEAALNIAKALNVAHHLVLPLDLRQFGGSALTADIPIPSAGGVEGIPVTYVPARNLIFLSLALGWAEALGTQHIYIGVNALDYSGYPDCRPEFIASFVQTARLATKAGAEGAAVEIHAPLQHWSKARIVQESQRLGLDTGLSWSCYDPTAAGFACGVCDSCQLRQKGFSEAGVVDGTHHLGASES